MSLSTLADNSDQILSAQRDVLDQCATQITVAPDLRTMDARLFRAGPLKL